MSDLTGVWTCDDDGTYYIRQIGNTVVWAGLHNSGFHKGIEFTNVFWGTLSPDEQSVIGEWADVPRGGSEGSGIIRFTIQNADVLGFSVRELVQDPNETSGGFGGKLWVKVNDGGMLGPQDIVDLFNRVQRFDKLLGENNTPCRDFSVVWGNTDETGCSREIYERFPERVRVDFGGPELPPEPTYCSFIQSGPSGGLDGDFTFNLIPDWNLTDPTHFWTTGWVSPAARQSMVDVYGSGAGGHDWGFFHCEHMMYGRENTDDDDDCNAPARVLLPGWKENSGDSILVNGRPIAGNVTSGVVDDSSNYLRFEIGFLGLGQQVRVTGVVTYDQGHAPGFVTPDGGESPLPPTDSIGVFSPIDPLSVVYQPPEIHPVYQIDIITDQFRAAFPQTLSGAWHGTPDNGTYYIRQLGNTVWWLGLSSDQGRAFANVFRGTLNNTTGLIDGKWFDVPMGANSVLENGTLQLGPVGRQPPKPPGHIPHFPGVVDHPGGVDHQNAHQISKVTDSTVFGATSWQKLYDTPGVPVPPIGLRPEA
jgi:hypothetical protein